MSEFDNAAHGMPPDPPDLPGLGGMLHRLAAEGEKLLYMDSGDAPKPGDRIHAGDSLFGKLHREEFVTVVREVKGEYLITAGWPECAFPVRFCTLVERGEL